MFGTLYEPDSLSWAPQDPGWVGRHARDRLGAEGVETDHSLCPRPRRGQLVPALRLSCQNDLPSPPPAPQLEVTADLAERRRIRSAIRELQRQELEREEEALASKRFRAERQDNKENWLQ